MSDFRPNPPLEYRFFALSEPQEARTGPSGDIQVVEGLAVAYGDTARLYGFSERFEAGAFGDVSKVDALANLHHDRTKPLARTMGGGLIFTDTTAALTARIELPDTRDGHDAAELLKRGILRGLSLEFRVIKERSDQSVRVIEKADLVGVALVDKPAYGKSIAAIATRYAVTGTALAKRRIWL